MKYSSQWSRLDNAAKIFPPTSTKRDTKVFRFACELFEQVESEHLQCALDRTLKQFPFYRCVLKKGLFWYYLEESNIKPQVTAENKPPCMSLYTNNGNNLLFEVSYYKKRINLEAYHALADGTGAMLFFRQMILYYLNGKYGENGSFSLADYNTTAERSGSDSFSKYYSKEKSPVKQKNARAYKIRGERYAEYRLGILEGRMSAKSTLEAAHRYGATLTEFLTALLMCAINEGMTLREEQRPVVITIPVDLRKYFRTESARNFFGVVNINHNFKTHGKDFDDVISNVKTVFKERLKLETLRGRMNHLSALEHNLTAKLIPLILKIPILKAANWISELEITAAISNLGRITMPEEIRNRIKLFDVFSSTKRVQACLCSFGDELVVSFTSPFISTDIQCCFFRKLVSMGLEVEIVSNMTETESTDGEPETGGGGDNNVQM